MNGWIIVIIIAVVAFIVFAVERSIKVHRRTVTTGREELIGKIAKARTPLTPEGQIVYKGEIWAAVSESGDIATGSQVIIIKLDGLILYVKRK
jgi:membrane-bound ClpP family serine protease